MNTSNWIALFLVSFGVMGVYLTKGDIGVYAILTIFLGFMIWSASGIDRLEERIKELKEKNG